MISVTFPFNEAASKILPTPCTNQRNVCKKTVQCNHPRPAHNAPDSVFVQSAPTVNVLEMVELVERVSLRRRAREKTAEDDNS